MTRITRFSNGRYTFAVNDTDPKAVPLSFCSMAFRSPRIVGQQSAPTCTHVDSAP